jgi:GTP-binding protein EngB required for normal cell division
LLVVGASRWGKSVLLNLLVWQLLGKPKALVEKLYLCDLKGVGFQKFAKDKRVTVARTVADVASVVRRLVTVELKQRVDFMLKHGVENYPGARIFVFFDEYAVLQQHAVLKSDKLGEARKEQLLVSTAGRKSPKTSGLKLLRRPHLSVDLTVANNGWTAGSVKAVSRRRRGPKARLYRACRAARLGPPSSTGGDSQAAQAPCGLAISNRWF